MRARALVSIVAGTAVLVGVLATPASAESEESEQIPPLPTELPAELPELPAELPEIPGLPELPVEFLDVLNATGLTEILECVAGDAALPDVSAPSPDAVIGVLLCVGEKLLALVTQAVADLVATATEAAPAA